MEDLSTKITNDQLTAAEFVQPMSEQQLIITNSGQSLTNADVAQHAKALSTQIPSGGWMTATGAMPTKVLTTPGSPGYQPVRVLENGQWFRFRSTDASTDTVTLNVDGLGAKSLLRESGGALQPGDVASDIDALVRFDSGADAFFLLNPRAQLYPKGYWNGFLLTNDTIDAVNDFKVGEGSCANHDGTFNLDLVSGDTRRIDLDRAGSILGMFPSALTLGAAENYFVFIIGGKDALTSWGVDSSATATNILADATTQTGDTYDKYRQMGFVQWTGSEIKLIWQDPNDMSRIIYDAGKSQVFFDNTSPSGALTTSSVNVPAETTALLQLRLYKGSNSNEVYAWCRRTDATNTAPTRLNSDINTDSNEGSDRIDMVSNIEVYVGPTSEVRHRGDSGGTFSSDVKDWEITCRGYRYVRDRV